MIGELRISAGNTHPWLARAVAAHLAVPLGGCEVFRFRNEIIFVRILDNVRQRDAFVIQPISSPVDRSLVELLIMLDALKRASVGRITAVVPYYGYGRTDKKDQPRAPITARLVADLLTVAGANRLLTIDLHAGLIQGFFSTPVDELTALHLIGEYFKEKSLRDLVVVASDIGISKRARDLAAWLDAPLSIMEKRRVGSHDRTKTLNVIGDVEGKVALVFDDEIDTAGSLKSAISALTKRGAKEVYACCTHPILSGPAYRRLASSPLKEVVVTDTVPIKAGKGLGVITVLSIAPLLAEAMYRIHNGLSVGALFKSGCHKEGVSDPSSATGHRQSSKP